MARRCIAALKCKLGARSLIAWRMSSIGKHRGILRRRRIVANITSMDAQRSKQSWRTIATRMGTRGRPDGQLLKRDSAATRSEQPVITMIAPRSIRLHGFTLRRYGAARTRAWRASIPHPFHTIATPVRVIGRLGGRRGRRPIAALMGAHRASSTIAKQAQHPVGLCRSRSGAARRRKYTVVPQLLSRTIVQPARIIGRRAGLQGKKSSAARRPALHASLMTATRTFSLLARQRRIGAAITRRSVAQVLLLRSIAKQATKLGKPAGLKERKSIAASSRPAGAIRTTAQKETQISGSTARLCGVASRRMFIALQLQAVPFMIALLGTKIGNLVGQLGRSIGVAQKEAKPVLRMIARLGWQMQRAGGRPQRKLGVATITS